MNATSYASNRSSQISDTCPFTVNKNCSYSLYTECPKSHLAEIIRSWITQLNIKPTTGK